MTTPEQPPPLEGYEPFFGLNEPPFSLAPDTRFLFASASHSAALAQVAYAIERREPLVVVTGEIGTGKTLLCRTMLQRLPLKTFLSVIDDPLLDRDDLLKQVLEDFGIISKDRTRLTETTRHELVQTLQAFLASLAKIQAHAVVMIDEAQHLQPDVLEQIRLLSNIDDASGTLLQVVLVGQTALEPLLARPELRQLQQRVTRRFALEPLNRDEVEQYVAHRLSLAGASTAKPRVGGATEGVQDPVESPETKPGVTFTPDAIETLSQLSGGVPRVINVLCDRALEAAHAARLRIIDRGLIQTAASALGIEAPAAPAAQASPEMKAPVPAVETDASIWDVAGSVPAVGNDVVHPISEAVPGFGASPPPASAPNVTRYVVLAAAVLLTGAAVLFLLRPAQPPAGAATSSAAAASAPAAPVARPAPARADTPPPPAAATAAATAGTATPPQAAAPVSPAPAAAAAGERFDIIVASFRTDARATSVEAEVTALGLPIHRRVSEGWQQVIAGPFASRNAAEDAQQRIHRAGLTGTQIVPAAR